jgi:hypothetical protein
MSMRTGWSVALAFLIAGTPAIADEPGAAAKTEKPAKPKKICRYEGWTGSRVARRTCATEAEWAEYDTAMAAEAKETLRKIADNGRTLPQGMKNPAQMGPNGFSGE